MPDRPYLLIDVDGVLNPFGARRRPEGYDEYRIDGYRVWLNPTHGAWLLRFADRFELAWATTWGDRANACIGPRLKLPVLPVVPFDFAASGSGSKWPAIATFVGNRPFVWIEDDPWPDEKSAVRHRHRSIPSRLVMTDPVNGLRAAHLAIIERFARDLVVP